MSDTAPSFGGAAYTSQTTKALASITESPGPDLSDGEQQFVSMLSRHDYQIKFLADNQQQLQVGVNQATSNPIQQIQQFIADVQVLVSGASLPKGALDFGDLQYELPALGALFGFGTGGPVNLFQAAENFFFGYVVPTQQYTDLQIAGFNSYAQALGIDPQFIKDVDAMTQAFGDLFNGLQNLGPSVASLFDELGITGTDLGPLGQLLAPILKWFAPIDFSKFGTLIEWLTDAIDPWVTGVTAVINWVNALLAAIGAGGDVVNSPLPQVTVPFANLIKLFATLDLTDPEFSTAQGWGNLFSEIFVDLEQFVSGVWSALSGAPLNANNLYGQLSPGLFSNVPATAITADDTELLLNGGFNGAISLGAGLGVWSWDGIVYYPPGDSTASPGSVLVTADGGLHELDSNQVTVGPQKQVTPGRQLTYAVQVLGTHLTATGMPVQLGVRTNLGLTVLDSTLPETSPATTPWVAPPTGSQAGVLSGTYLVPQDGSVTWLAMVLIVDTTATAGLVRFSNALEFLTGGLIGDLQSDLADLQDDATRINAANTAFMAAITAAVTAFFTNFDWSQLIATLTPAYNTWITTITDLTDGEYATLTSILDSLLGIDPTTGQSTWVTQLLSWLTGTNTGAGRLASIAAPAVANKVHTPQVVPNFANGASIAGTGWAGGGWSWDSAMSWEGSGGSAKTVADGTLKALGGVMVPVQPGQTVAVGETSADGSTITTAPVVQWAALAAASGVPIQFQLIPYSGAEGSRVAGTPFVLAQSTSLGANQSSWLPLTLVTDSGNHVAAGVYTVPSSGVTAIQARLVVNSVTTAGSVWWNNCDLVIAGGYLPSIAAGVTELQEDATASNVANQTFLQAIENAVIDYTDPVTFLTAIGTAYQIWASTQSGLAADEFATLEQMFDLAIGIDPNTGLMQALRVQGVEGLQTLQDTITTLITQLGAALDGDPADAGGFAWLAQLLNALGVKSDDAHTLATNAADALAYPNNAASYVGPDDTSEANMPTASVNWSTAAVTLSSSLAAIGLVRCTKANTKGAISFLAEQGSATAFYLSAFKLDKTTGDLTYLWTSPNIITLIPTSKGWARYVFSSAEDIPVGAGDVLAFVFLAVGGGATLYGQPSGVPNHPSAVTANWGGSITTLGSIPPSGNLASSSWSFTSTFPYVSVEVTAEAQTFIPPFPQQWASAGTYTSDPIPDWANFVDVVMVGAGANSQSSPGANTYGSPGLWTTNTLAVGTDIAIGATLTAKVPSGNAYSPSNPEVDYTDMSAHAQTIVGTSGHFISGTASGAGPGNIAYENTQYFGGNTVTLGNGGSSPGGGAGTPWIGGTTLPGADGSIWVVFRQ